MRDPAKTFKGSIEEARYGLIPARRLDYGDVSGLKTLLVEAGKAREAYSQAILNSDSWLLNT